MSIAENLKTLRKKRKLSQDQLEARSGVSQATISYIERGEKIPTLDTIKLLADGLRVPLIELIEGKKQPSDILNEKKADVIARIRYLQDSDIPLVAAFLDGLEASQENKTTSRSAQGSKSQSSE